MMRSLLVLFLGIFVAVCFTAAEGGTLVGHDVPIVFNVRLFILLLFHLMIHFITCSYLISIKLVLLFLI